MHFQLRLLLSKLDLLLLVQGGLNLLLMIHINTPRTKALLGR
jgi:hypothetical protein